MGDDRRRDDPRPGDPAEGVRIIGAEEAAEAIERGDVAPRRGGDIPRYGDRPAPPAVGPRPALRFPLDAGSDPSDAAAVRPASGQRFDPRPAPAWDDPAPDDDDAGGDDPWPDTGAWAGAEPGWEDPKDDVVAWSTGDTEATPVVGEVGSAEPSGLSWADDFVGDDGDDPWDGTWDEPSGSVTWADDVAEAAPDGAPAAEAAASEGDDVDVRRRGRRLFGRSTPAEPAPAEPVPADPGALVDDQTSVEGGADDATEVADRPLVGEVDLDVTDDAVVADVTDDAVADVRGDDEDDAGFFDAALYDSAELPAVAGAGDEGPDEVGDEGEEGAGLFDADGGWAEEPETVFSFDDEPSGRVELPHWTEPGTGELPRVLAGDDAPVSGSTPAVHWRSHDSAWGDGGFDDLADISDEVRVGALDLDRPTDDDIYSFDELDPEPEPEPIGPSGGRRLPPPRPSVDQTPPSSGGAGRNLPVAVGVAVAFGAVALIAFAVGKVATVALVTVILFLAIVEFQNAVRRAGYRPAALFGIVATVCYPLAVYWKGIEAYPLLAVLTVVTALVWHLVGADGDARVVESAGVTLLGVAWIGGLGSFAALLLTQPDGIGLLLAAVVATIAYDVGGLAVGRSMGARPLSDASPNKTVEGLVGGMLVCLFVMIVWGLFGVAPLDGPGAALKIGFLAALAAPLGDLCESLVKRDLGVKDMGSLLPEHGGILDRFDALLFVLPAVWYATVLFGLGVFA